MTARMPGTSAVGLLIPPGWTADERVILVLPEGE